jgi:hypothetical protein
VVRRFFVTFMVGPTVRRLLSPRFIEALPFDATGN